MKATIRCALAALAVAGCTLTVRGTRTANAQQCCSVNDCEYPAPSCPSPACDHIYGTCSYYWVCDSPIIVDVENKGFHLTSESAGVRFKFFGKEKHQVAWTDPEYGNAWLALDRNGNGKIDDASELFGNFTPQPQSDQPNGFVALAQYDLPRNGGNADGYITKTDSIYKHLLLWTDANHNGESEPNELKTLEQVGVSRISLNYSQGRKQDQYGNLFRYHGHLRMTSHDYDRKIYDVYLVGTVD